LLFQSESQTNLPTSKRQEAHHELPGALLSSVTHSLKILHNIAVIHPCIPQRSLHILVTQYLLHTKNGHARIEQQRRTGMSELVRGDVNSALPAHCRQTGLTITAAQRLTVIGEDIFRIPRQAIDRLNGLRTEEDHSAS